MVYSATPDNTGTRPPAVSLTAAMTVRFSAALNEQFSPTVPMQMTPSTPSSMRAATTFCVAATSRRSSRVNCVVVAGNTPDHFFMSAPSVSQVECGNVYRGRAPRDQVGHGPRGDRAQRETDVLVPECVEQVGRRGHPAHGG